MTGSSTSRSVRAGLTQFSCSLMTQDERAYGWTSVWVVSPGEGALYARPNDDQDLATQIVALLDDPGWRASMGQYNRQRFLERMAWEHQAGELVRAYERLCATPGA